MKTKSQKDRHLYHESELPVRGVWLEIADAAGRVSAYAALLAGEEGN